MVLILCFLIKVHKFGSVKCTDNNVYGSKCILSCPTGFEEVLGQSRVVCLENASWSGSIGYCQSKFCVFFVNGIYQCLVIATKPNAHTNVRGQRFNYLNC